MIKRYFEFISETSNKFWEIWIAGNEIYTHYGKIGTNGQTAIKDAGSPIEALKLHDKLVREKIAKGYIEKSSGKGTEAVATDYLAKWKSIISAADPKSLLREHLSFLAVTAEDRKRLDRLLGKVKSVSIEARPDFRSKGKDNDHKTNEVKILCLWFENPETTSVFLHPPFTGKLNMKTPHTLDQFVRVHNGIEWESGGGGPVGFLGVDTSGGTRIMSDLSDFTNEDDLVDNKLIGALDCGQNILCWNVAEKNKRGEPVWVFIDHEDGESQPIEAELTFSQVILCLLAMEFLDEHSLGDVSL